MGVCTYELYVCIYITSPRKWLEESEKAITFTISIMMGSMFWESFSDLIGTSDSGGSIEIGEGGATI